MVGILFLAVAQFDFSEVTASEWNTFAVCTYMLMK